jgi:hypothetical protein
MTDEQRTDDDAARRVDRPATAPEDLPYDREMTEPDEANAPDATESPSTGDREIGGPDDRPAP